MQPVEGLACGVSSLCASLGRALYLPESELAPQFSLLAVEVLARSLGEGGVAPEAGHALGLRLAAGLGGVVAPGGFEKSCSVLRVSPEALECLALSGSELWRPEGLERLTSHSSSTVGYVEGGSPAGSLLLDVSYFEGVELLLVVGLGKELLLKLLAGVVAQEAGDAKP